MARAGKAVFDAQVFVAIVGTGKTILEFQKNKDVFTQGDVAGAVFYIQKGKVKVTVQSEQGKEAVVGILGPGQFFGEGCMNGPQATHLDDDGDGRQRDHFCYQRGDVGRPS